MIIVKLLHINTCRRKRVFRAKLVDCHSRFAWRRSTILDVLSSGFSINLCSLVCFFFIAVKIGIRARDTEFANVVKKYDSLRFATIALRRSSVVTVIDTSCGIAQKYANNFGGIGEVAPPVLAFPL